MCSSSHPSATFKFVLPVLAVAPVVGLKLSLTTFLGRDVFSCCSRTSSLPARAERPADRQRRSLRLTSRCSSARVHAITANCVRKLIRHRICLFGERNGWSLSLGYQPADTCIIERVDCLFGFAPACRLSVVSTRSNSSVDSTHGIRNASGVHQHRPAQGPTAAHLSSTR